jgi:hypothetical protein
MLDCVDQRASSLPPAPRVLVLGLRLWAKALERGRCPVAPLHGVLVHRGVSGALWPAHNLFSWTVEHASRRLYLGCPCCGRVGDDEALLLAAVLADGEPQREAALSGLIAQDAVPRGLRMARALQGELCRLRWNEPASDPNANSD